MTIDTELRNRLCNAVFSPQQQIYSQNTCKTCHVHGSNTMKGVVSQALNRLYKIPMLRKRGSQSTQAASINKVLNLQREEQVIAKYVCHLIHVSSSSLYRLSDSLMFYKKFPDKKIIFIFSNSPCREHHFSLIFPDGKIYSLKIVTERYNDEIKRQKWKVKVTFIMSM